MIRASTVCAIFLAATVGCATEAADENTSDTEQLASVHLKGGKNAEPTFIDLGMVLNATGQLSGLGNGDVLIELTAMANPTSTCGNPGKNTWQAPGQNPATVEVTGSQAIPAEEIKNGNTPFDVTTLAPVTPVPGAPDCPNSSWIEVITDLSFISATITVYQPGLVLTVTCTIDPESSDGSISGADVSCSSS